MKSKVQMLAMVIAMGAAVGTTACCKKGSPTSGSGTGSTSDLFTISNAHTQFNAPAGWKQMKSGDWTQFMPADKLASLAFVTFDRPGESTSRIGQIASVLNVQNIAWGSPRSGTLGVNSFPSHMGDGTCTIAGTSDPCYVWYATVNPGGAEQVLIVYAVNTAKGSAHKANAKAAIDSLRKM